MNLDKLDWMNKEHIKKLSKEGIEKNIFANLPENYRNPKIINLITERISKWSDVKGMVRAGELDFFFNEPKFSKEKLLYKDVSLAQISNNLDKAKVALEGIDEKNFTTNNIKEILMTIAEHLPSKGELLHPLRFALSGLDKSPDPFMIAEILGKNETLSRIQKAI